MARPAFVSTRGGRSVSFEEALLRGLAPDGGLYVPEHVQQVDFFSLAQEPTFGRLAFEVFRTWLEDVIETEELKQIVEDALNFEVPLVSLGGWEDVYVLELFHGPTLSFKDFGARTMGQWMRYILREREDRVTVLVATSGDTGSAVADGFAGQDRIEVILLYPRGQVSEVQERQLIVSRPGVRAFAVDGDFDDCQRLVKEAFVDERLRTLNLSSANSINIGRLLPQMLYYMWAVRELALPDVLFCVPSGNLGNLTGGILAYLSGMPVRGFLAAHNENDFFPRFLAGEDARFKPTISTLSNAMDVGAPSNFERLEKLLDEEALRSLVRGVRVSNEETLQSIERVYRETGYLADPHTAVGLEAVRRTGAQADGPVVVLSTAHPAKFPETIERAVGFKPDPPRRLAALWEHDVSVTGIGPSLEDLRRVVLGSA